MLSVMLQLKLSARKGQRPIFFLSGYLMWQSKIRKSADTCIKKFKHNFASLQHHNFYDCKGACGAIGSIMLELYTQIDPAKTDLKM